MEGEKKRGLETGRVLFLFSAFPPPNSSLSPLQLTIYIALLATGVTALATEPWLTSPADLWRGWPHMEALPPRLAFYYLAEAAFYGASTFMLLWWEVRRADFAAMLTHHVATCVLIGGSHILRYHRVGSIVMLLHDPSDVLLEAAKLASYAGWHGIAGCLFCGLAASWAVLRLAALPRVVRSVLIDAPAILGGPPAGSRPLAAALALLVGLHAYWFGLIVRVGVHSVAGRGLRDAREADEAEAREVAAAAAAAAKAPARRSTRARKAR